MKQIISIHWWEWLQKEALYTYLKTLSFDLTKTKKRWSYRLQLQCENIYEVIMPDMPNKYSADYTARKIRFERHFIYLNKDETILIWRSLGASFLIKRLSENTFPKHISQLHLVGTMLHNDGIPWEWLQQFISNLEKVPNIQNQVDQIYIYHSKDDTIVPYKDAENLIKLLPKAEFITFTDRWHFHQETFPELLENINN